MAELAERLGLDLPDPLPRDREALAHLFERVLALLADAEAQAQDLLLLGRQSRQRPLDLAGEVLAQQRVVGRAGTLVLQEVTEFGILPDWCFQRKRLPRRLQDEADLLRRHTRALRELLGRGLPAHLVDHVPVHAGD